ncbi:GspE/PulE family protein [Hyphobacterium sp.]|uniref:GspE/PulE family protein n=1 Tax=Hyphobacterium sp. TaxID=2004662 RepID=UPI003BAB2F6A
MDSQAETGWIETINGLSEADIGRARRLSAETGERLARALKRLGAASDIAIADALANATGLERISLDAFPAQPLEAGGVSPQFLQDASAIPIALEDREIVLAVADPTDPAPAEGIRLATGLNVALRVAAFADIEAAHSRLYGEAASGTESIADDFGDGEDLKDLASEAPVVRLVNDLLSEALNSRASDIHIEPFRDRLRIRFRIDGVLHDQTPPKPGLARLVTSRVKILAGLDIAERRRPQDGRARTTISGRALDLRVATAPTAHGESVTIRLLEDRDTQVKLDDLGLSEKQRTHLTSHLSAPYGLILVTGPTGSGKTTTLAGALDQLNVTERKLVSIEDPIEYQIEGVNQIAVNSPIGLTFASVLRSVLRHDPDVIVVGELRDGETAEIAINAALTGHLVLATVHTNTASGAAPRLIDMGVDPALLRSTLRLSIAQRLVRQLCPDCKTPDAPPPGLKTAWKAVGCEHCAHTGYRGRIGVFEFVDIKDDIADALKSGVAASEIEKLARQKNMSSIRGDALTKVEAGITSIDEVNRVLGAA